MSSEMLFFILRFIGFVAMSVIFFIAGRMAFHNIVWKDYLEEKDKLDRRRVTARVLCLIGTVFGLSSILELCINNPNEWLGMKISWYIFFSSFPTYLTFILEEDELTRSEREKIKLIPEVLTVPACFSAVAFIGFLIFGSIWFASQPTISVEREVLSSVELVTVKDSYRSEGKPTDNLLETTFAISDHGVYRYYYRSEDDDIEQGHVDACETSIYPIKEGEAPHLDCVASYEYKTHLRNKEPYKTKNNEKTWYELHVPKGSVVEAYEFDLN